MDTFKKVGVRELKNKASELINYVLLQRHSVLISKNDKVVARLVPIEESTEGWFQDSGLLASAATNSWGDYQPIHFRLKASRALKAIREDRDQR